MKSIVDVCLSRNRGVVLALVMIFIFGGHCYSVIAREKNPDIQIPMLVVSVTLRGVSPIDSERMLVKPIENVLRSVQGIKEMRGVALDGMAYVILEFYAGLDIKQSLQDVRAKLDDVRANIPTDADSPTVEEINVSLFPVLNVALMGNVPDRTLTEIALDLQEKLEGLPNVLSADIAGLRKNIVEVIVEPATLLSYDLQLNDVLSAISGNNVLIGAGNIDNKSGAFSVKIPGILFNVQDIMSVPLKVYGDSVVTIRDVATIHATYEDPTGFARVNGQPCLVLEVSKRTGRNVIETISEVKAVVSAMQKFWPENLTVLYSQDQSDSILSMLNELENSVILAVLLVVLVIMIFMGTRISMLVALSIPGSFLIGISVIYLMGYTLNIVVLFSLIMSVGMLVDDSIVVSEYADRKMISGLDKHEAFRAAANDMFWPVVAATLTKLAVFLPLLFWPGTTGEFMKYMPVTLIATLTGSLVMALVFTPVLGSFFGKPSATSAKDIEFINAIESGEVQKLDRVMKFYASLLNIVIDHPKKFIGITTSVLLTATIVYFTMGPGIDFFPSVEPDNAMIQVRAKGNLSTREKDDIVRNIENLLLDMKNEVKVFYARSGLFQAASKDQPDDLIGKIQIEFQDWRVRRKAHVILTEIKKRLKGMYGIVVNVDEEKDGPSTGKAIQIDLSSHEPDLILPALEKVYEVMKSSPGFISIQDTRSSPEIEWNLDINRSQAAKFGANVALIGNFVQMITNGTVIGKYRPENVKDEVDIIARFPSEYRTIKMLDRLLINTVKGNVAVADFVHRVPQLKLKKINRIDGLRTLTISSDVAPGYLVDERIKYLRNHLSQDWDPKVLVAVKGESEDSKEAQSFLSTAFIVALMLMIFILIIEFNSAYHTFIVMTAVFLSTTCVFLGLLLTDHVFGIVMGGVGIIALAGIVVNNNILLIDAFQHNLAHGLSQRDSVLRAGVSRVRPILLTAGTAILGLLPMIFKVSIDFFTREIEYDSPSSQWWIDLSSTIASGLLFATILTLFYTPCLLMLEKFKSDSH